MDEVPGPPMAEPTPSQPETDIARRRILEKTLVTEGLAQINEQHPDLYAEVHVVDEPIVVVAPTREQWAQVSGNHSVADDGYAREVEDFTHFVDEVGLDTNHTLAAKGRVVRGRRGGFVLRLEHFRTGSQQLDKWIGALPEKASFDGIDAVEIAESKQRPHRMEVASDHLLRARVDRKNVQVDQPLDPEAVHSRLVAGYVTDYEVEPERWGRDRKDVYHPVSTLRMQAIQTISRNHDPLMRYMDETEKRAMRDVTWQGQEIAVGTRYNIYPDTRVGHLGIFFEADHGHAGDDLVRAIVGAFYDDLVTESGVVDQLRLTISRHGEPLEVVPRPITKLPAGFTPL